AGREGRAHARALLREPRRLGRARLPAGVSAHGLARGDRRTEYGAVLLHETEDFRRASVAVLDRLDARQHGATHSFRAARVRDDGPARARGDLHDPLELLERERRLHVAARAPTVVRVDLDPVRAATDLVA